MINLPLTIEKDGFFDTKTTCFAPFAIVAAAAKGLFFVDNDGGGVVVAADDGNGLAGLVAIEA